MKVGKEIALLAKKQGICKEWFSEMLSKSDIKPLCKMFFDGSDWSMENDFPDLATLRRFKGHSDLYGIHTDFKGVVGLESILNRVAFFGNSEVEIDAGGFSVGEIYIRHDTKAKIKAYGHSFLAINVLDSARVQIECTDDARVTVYAYGNLENITVHGFNVDVIAKKFD